MTERFASTSGYPRRVFRRADAPRVTFTLDGEAVEAVAGETLLAALLSIRSWPLRSTESAHAPRGMFCGMGVCMDCLVHVEGEGLVRACTTFVRAGLVCQTLRPAEGAGYPLT